MINYYGIQDMDFCVYWNKLFLCVVQLEIFPKKISFNMYVWLFFLSIIKMLTMTKQCKPTNQKWKITLLFHIYWLNIYLAHFKISFNSKSTNFSQFYLNAKWKFVCNKSRNIDNKTTNNIIDSLWKYLKFCFFSCFFGSHL